MGWVQVEPWLHIYWPQPDPTTCCHPYEQYAIIQVFEISTPGKQQDWNLLLDPVEIQIWIQPCVLVAKLLDLDLDDCVF